MLTLRQYIPSDATTVVGWIKDEMSLRLWCADRFKSYPLAPNDFNKIYADLSMKGIIAEYYGKPVGHLFMKDLGENVCKFGLIIVDNSIRGKGFGKKMLSSAIKYATTVLNAEHITLSVFEKNVSAYECYKKLGFKETGKYEEYFFLGDNHRYIELIYEI